MVKEKGKKSEPGGSQRHIRARISFLHKAANLLQQHAYIKQKDCQEDGDNQNATSQSYPLISSLPRQYVSQMRGISLKSQQRLPIEVKRSICKRCDLILIQGTTCEGEIRNESRGQKKPWADVRVVRCRACGVEKRFPMCQKRSQKLAVRHRQHNISLHEKKITPAD